MEEYEEIMGKIIEVNKNSFKVYMIESKIEYECEYEKGYPIRIGDAIYGICKKEKGILKFIKPPFVQIGMDKETIIKNFINGLHGKNIGIIKSNELYNKFVEMASEDDRYKDNMVYEYITELAIIWEESKDEELLKTYNYIIKIDKMSKLLEWWYKNCIIRRLYLIGLNDKEIKNIKMSVNKIYDKCIENPYKIVEINIEKCEEILKRFNKRMSEEDKKCGIIIRKIYEYNKNKGWIGIPNKILSSIYPDILKYIDKLRNEYNVKTELFTIYLEEYYNIEIKIKEYIEKVLKMDNKKIYSEIKFIKSNLSDDQKEAIIGSINNNIAIIKGSAGTGKTTIIKEIINIFKIKKIKYLIVSFTGKAVSRIREVLNDNTPSTINKAINNHKKLDKFEYLIIDEASMITSELFYNFICKFNHNYKIIFIGDPNQLEPIGIGNLFEQLILSDVIPIFELRSIHRTNSNDIINNLSNMLKYSLEDDGKNIPFKFECSDNFQLINGSIEKVYDIINILINNGISYKKITVITPFNLDVNLLNIECQKIFNNGNKFITDSRNISWYLKDRVTLIVNRYDINIMNGEEGIIVDIFDNGITVNFKDGSFHNFKIEPCNYNSDNLELSDLSVLLLRHSFALNVHLSQGSEWDYIIFYIPQLLFNNSFLNKKLIYTALSRAKKSIWCVGDLISLNISAIRNPVRRCDNLSHRLSNKNIQI